MLKEICKRREVENIYCTAVETVSCSTGGKCSEMLGNAYAADERKTVLVDTRDIMQKMAQRLSAETPIREKRQSFL